MHDAAGGLGRSRKRRRRKVLGPNNRCIGTFRWPDMVPDSDASWWDGPFLAAGGKQLWFVHRDGPTLYKYAIPQ